MNCTWPLIPSITCYFPSVLQGWLTEEKLPAPVFVPSNVALTLKNRPLFRNCIHFELLIVLNFQKALVELQKELFFAIPKGCLEQLAFANEEISWIQNALTDDQKLGEILKRAEKLRFYFIQYALEFFGQKTAGLFADSFQEDLATFCESARITINEIENQRVESLRNCHQNIPVQGNLKQLVDELLQTVEVLKEKLREIREPFEILSDDDIDCLHNEEMEIEEYAKSYEVMHDLFYVLGDPNNPLWKSPKRSLGYLSLLLKPSVWHPLVEQARDTFLEKLESSQKKVHGEDYQAVMRFQKLSIIHDSWLKALEQIAKNIEQEHGEERSFRYTCAVMHALSLQKLQFYQKLFRNRKTLACVSLRKLSTRNGITPQSLQKEIQDKEGEINEAETSLKCYSWKLASCAFLWTAATDNIFFRLGKDMFVMAEKISSGTQLEEPYLSGFSYLTGGVVFGSRIYLSPTVAGSAFVVHALVERALSDVSKLTHYGSELFGLIEEQTVDYHPKLMLASAFGVSTLMFGNQNVFQVGVNFGSSVAASYFFGKAVDKYYLNSLKPGSTLPPSYSTARLITGLGAHIFGFMLGNYAWNVGAAYYFDHYSTECILFDDKVCAKLNRKCLEQARRELGVNEHTPFDDIKAKYHHLSLTMHPDKTPDIREFEKINAAWTVIRKSYQEKNNI